MVIIQNVVLYSGEGDLILFDKIPVPTMVTNLPYDSSNHGNGGEDLHSRHLGESKPTFEAQ